MQPWQNWDRGICGHGLLFAGLFQRMQKRTGHYLLSCYLALPLAASLFGRLEISACHFGSRPSLALAVRSIGSPKNLLHQAEGISQPLGRGNRRALLVRRCAGYALLHSRSLMIPKMGYSTKTGHFCCGQIVDY